MIYVAFLLLAALVVFLSIKLGKYVDLLDKTTKISGAFMGSVLLAAVTSLPELFTSLSATLLLQQNGLVLGNILGSNLFNLAVFGAVVVFLFPKFRNARITKSHLLTIFGFLLIYGLIAVAIFFVTMPKLGWINIVSFLIPIVYVVVLLKMPKVEETEETAECDLTTKQILARFIVAAVLLVAASICITYVSDAIAEALRLGKTFAGALLLGITTSLPELVSTVTLCKRGNFNAAAGNIFGSNLFNFLILFLADIFSFREGTGSVYIAFNSGEAGTQAMLLLFLGIAASLLVLFTLLTKHKAKQESRLLPAVALPGGTCAMLAYILFTVLSIVLV